MTGLAMTFRQNLRAKRENDFGLENALAAYVRRRWPEKTIPHVQQHFSLSESQAAKVVYANASKNTLKELLHHPNGGFPLFLELLAEATGTTLEAYIEKQAEEARRERAQWEERERHLAALAARVSEPSGRSWRPAEQAGAGRPGHQGVGPGEDGAADALIFRRTVGGEP